MAFSTTITRADGGRTIREAIVTLVDTAGNSANLTGFELCDRITVHAQLTGTAGTVALQGSNDGTNFYALPTAVSLTASGIKAVAADGLGFKVYRLNLSGGDATTNHTVRVVGTIQP